MERITVARALIIEGKGLHGGGKTTLLLKPGSDGIVFTTSERRIPATPLSVVDTRLNATIGDGTVMVSTIEHLMSALYGLMITDCEIEVMGDEIPAMDGSALPFLRRLKETGIRPIGRKCEPIRISSVFRSENGDAWIEARPGPFSLTYEINFPDPAIGEQRYCYTGDDYTSEIAPARTFGRLQDVEAMWEAGLAQGGGLHNAVVVNGSNIVNPEGLRFPDECVRHKILDALGDLWTLGVPLIAQIKASKASHTLHIDLAKKIFASMKHRTQE